MSAPLSPLALTRTSTSPVPGSGSGRSWTATTPSSITAARMAPQSSLGCMRPTSESTILITGATEGLDADGASLLLHGRDPAKLDALREQLDGARTLQADFTSLDEVRRLAGE